MPSAHERGAEGFHVGGEGLQLGLRGRVAGGAGEWGDGSDGGGEVHWSLRRVLHRAPALRRLQVRLLNIPVTHAVPSIVDNNLAGGLFAVRDFPRIGNAVARGAHERRADGDCPGRARVRCAVVRGDGDIAPRRTLREAWHFTECGNSILAG